jgi:hypothetical protein
MEKQGQPGSNWLVDRLGQFNFLTALRERNHVRRTCIDTLNLCGLRTRVDAGVARLIPADL